MTLAPVPNPPVTVDTFDASPLRQELALWKDCLDLAKSISATPFVPDVIRNNPAAVMATILRGAELGVSAMHSLAQIDFIQGRPALRAELARALVLSKGHRLWVDGDNYTETAVTVFGQRAGDENVVKVTWTRDMAQRAGLLNKPPWKAYPRAMLLARATAELCRLLFADVLAGIAFTEEVEDYVDADAVDLTVETTPPPPKTSTTGTAKRGARRRATTAPPPTASAPPAPPLPEDEELENAGKAEPVGSATGIVRDHDPNNEPVVTAAQAIAIRASKIGVDHHNVLKALTGGQIASAKNLEPAMTRQVMDALAALEAGTHELVQRDDGWHLVDPNLRWEKPVEPTDDVVDAEVIVPTPTIDPLRATGRELADWLIERKMDPSGTLDELRNRVQDALLKEEF
jgi:hypothetical protein